MPRRTGSLFAALAILALSGCATSELTESGALSSYAGLRPSDGMLTKTKVRADKASLLAARTARIAPTEISDAARASGLTPAQLRLVSNAIDRTLCSDLSVRFQMVPSEQESDIVVRTVITRIAKTDKTAAATSVATSIGGTVATAATGVPIPSLRLPIGLGSLSVEGEAKTRDGQQVAAYVWARGADSFTTKPRVSEEADGHTLASAFAADFAKLLVTGTDPIAELGLPVINGNGITEYFGGDPKYVACKSFGKNPGLGHTLGGAVGLPPAWTDKGTGDPSPGGQ